MLKAKKTIGRLLIELHPGNYDIDLFVEKIQLDNGNVKNINDNTCSKPLLFCEK